MKFHCIIVDLLKFRIYLGEKQFHVSTKTLVFYSNKRNKQKNPKATRILAGSEPKGKMEEIARHAVANENTQEVSENKRKV